MLTGSLSHFSRRHRPLSQVVRVLISLLISSHYVYYLRAWHRLWSSLCMRQQVHGHYCSFQPKIPLAIFPCECHCCVLQCDGHGPVKVFARRCCCHIVRSINSTRRATLSATECEIPTTAALVTGSNAKVTSEIDIENRLCIILHELTALP